MATKKKTSKKTDGWSNTITAIGSATRDKRKGATVATMPYMAERHSWEALYTGDDMAATIVELPAREMTREKFTLNIDGEDQTDTEKAMTVAKDTMSALDDLDAFKNVFEAEVWSRVFGGALIFLGVDDGADLEEPLNPDRVRKVDFLKVFDRFEVHVNDWETDPTLETFGEPRLYTLQPSGSTGVATPVVKVHASRFVRLEGALTTRDRKAKNGGWSDSVYVRMLDVLGDFGLTWASAAHLMQDFAQAVIKMKDLASAIASDNSDLVVNRMIAMDLCRSVARAIPIDADNEDFQRVATPITGLPEMMDRFSSRMAAAARMPVTLLMGQSPGGLNATGESDITLFYDQIKAQQESKHRPVWNQLLTLLFKSAQGPTKGVEPEGWSIEFNPLWQMTDKEQADMRKVVAETDQIYLAEGVLDATEVAMSRFAGDAYSAETTLDIEGREKGLMEPEPAPPMVPMVPATPAQAATPTEPEEPVE